MRLLKAAWNWKVKSNGLRMKDWDWRVAAEDFQLLVNEGLGWMVPNKRLQQTGCDWSVAKEKLGLRTWDWGVTFEGFQLNACDLRDRQVAIDVL